MDQELIAYLDARFQAIETRFESVEMRIQGFREETLGRFDKVEERLQRAEDAIRDNQKAIRANEEAIRHTDIKVEALRGDIRLVADGVAAVDQKLDVFRVEVAKEFDQVRAENRASYTQLDRRVKALEKRARLS